MATLTEIALRRLDGAYFGELTDSSAPSFADRYAVALFGYTLSGNAEAHFKAATDTARADFISALGAKLPQSIAAATLRKAQAISTASELSAALSKSSATGTRLQLVSEADLAKLFERLVAQPLPYSEQDQLDLVELSSRFDVGALQAQARENNATLAGLFEAYDWTRSMTVTDALRVAAVWSGGDVTLEVPPKFKLKRSQRRAIALALEEVLNKSDYAYFDFARHRELWKRLFTALHVSDYNVPRLQGAANLLFNGQLSSIDSLIEFLIKERDFAGLMIHFRTMPGVFARRLNELLRKMPDRQDEIIAEFDSVASRVSTRVLVQLRNYFTGPSKADAPNLPFAGKSRTARDGFLENRKVGELPEVVEAIDKALSTKLSGKKIFIGDNGDGIGVLTSNRSTAIGSRAMAPGSRVPVGKDPEFVTLFTHWKNLEGSRVDLDLSALFLSEDLNRSEHLSFYSTTSAHARYSGDIVDAPDGAEEYITVDVKAAQSRKFRYMAIVVNSYTGQKIGSIPECYAGVAVSDSLNFQDFDAAGVEVRFDLTAEGREVIPLILDLETLELIWVDKAFSGARSGATMSGSGSLGSLLKFIVNYDGLTVGGLVEKTGAIRVDTAEEADISIDPRMSDQVAQLFI